MSNYDRYNLLNSAILEMFEFIKIEDIKSLCNHVVENFSTTLNKITYVKVNTSPLFVSIGLLFFLIFNGVSSNIFVL